MPNTKSAEKAMRSSARKRVINKKVKEKVRDELKSLRKSITAGSKDEAQAKLSKAMSVLDKAAKKGIIKKNNASRRKSRLAKAIDKIAK
jgi:small subunit ribosomal protein S20